MKVKFVTCDCHRDMNTDTSKLITVYKTLYICKYHSHIKLLFCKTCKMLTSFESVVFIPKKNIHIVYIVK